MTIRGYITAYGDLLLEHLDLARWFCDDSGSTLSKIQQEILLVAQDVLVEDAYLAAADNIDIAKYVRMLMEDKNCVMISWPI